jgi:hypothetical protein
VKLVISVDVEEEGLFSGKYSRTPTVANIQDLDRLAFIPDEFGFPLTLLVAHPVAVDPAACAVLNRWRDKGWAEIGAHLHHWNTPPLEELPYPVQSDLLPEPLLRRKFEALLDAHAVGLKTTPRSFRMGRFDFGRQVRRLLPEYGFTTDSSYAPLRAVKNGPDHFLVPHDPYWLDPAETGGRALYEVPLTMQPLVRGAPRLVYALANTLAPGPRAMLLQTFRTLAVVGIQPLWHPLVSMRWAATLHARRGGRVLTMFLHSTEIWPGGSPAVPDAAAAQRICDNIRAFLRWLTETREIQGVTLSDLERPTAPL